MNSANKVVILSSIIVMLAMMVNFNSQAQEEKIDKSKDQTLSIKIQSDGCGVVVINDSADNCTAEYGPARGKCQSDGECVCSKKDKRITWKSSQKEIKIKFHDQNKTPFNHQCTLESGGDGIISCKVKNQGDFHYDIYVKGCPDFHDPRIIIE